MNVNKLIVAGRLVADPLQKATKSGEPMAVFTIAVNTYWSDKEGNKKERADFFPVSFVGQKMTDLIINNVHKGDIALVEGKLYKKAFLDANGTPERHEIAISGVNIQWTKKNQSSDSAEQA